jgi:NAD-dependent deacetylase
MNPEHWNDAIRALRNARQVVVFTGAGISAESGIPTFRDADGFWQRFPPEQYANWPGLFQTARVNARAVAEFAVHLIEPIARAAPNAGHLGVAALERHIPTVVVTQNVDGLHQSAGSTAVHEIHGSLLEVVDTQTGQIALRFTRDDLLQISDLLGQYAHHEISLLSLLWKFRRRFPFPWRRIHRPHVVLFGDELAEPAWTEGLHAVEQCDLLISVGTSGTVYPAALLPERAASHGAAVISIDPAPVPGCWLPGTAATLLPKMLAAAF